MYLAALFGGGRPLRASLALANLRARCLATKKGTYVNGLDRVGLALHRPDSKAVMSTILSSCLSAEDEIWREAVCGKDGERRPRDEARYLSLGVSQKQGREMSGKTISGVEEGRTLFALNSCDLGNGQGQTQSQLEVGKE